MALKNVKPGEKAVVWLNNIKKGKLKLSVKNYPFEKMYEDINNSIDIYAIPYNWKKELYEQYKKDYNVEKWTEQNYIDIGYKDYLDFFQI